MIEHPSASVGLSLCVVAAATVLLVEPDRKMDTSLNVSTASAHPKKTASAASDPSPTPRIDWDSLTSRTAPPQAAEPVHHAIEKPSKASRKPEFSSTRVLDGEKLADVAARIYGPEVDLHSFWTLNRDQMPTFDSPLRAGMLLRTPEF